MYVQKTPWVVTLWSPCEEAANTRGRQEERREFQSCWKTTSSVKLEAADLQTTCWKNRLRPSLARSSQCFATYRLKLNWCCSVSLWNNKLTPECVLETPREQSQETPPILLSVFILSEKTQQHEPPCSPETCSPNTCSPDTCSPETGSPDTCSPEMGSPECVRIHLSVFNILKIIQSTTCWATNLSGWISWRFKSFGCKHDNK